MERKQIIANVSIVSISILFLAIMMWYLPDKALELLFVSIVSVSSGLFIIRKTKFDQQKDERTIQLMILGGRNAIF